MSNESMKVSREMQDIAQELDARIETVAGRRVPWTLVIFTDGVGSFITSTNRKDNIRELQKILDLMLSDEPLIPAHEGN